jgi:hypothetical protein
MLVVLLLLLFSLAMDEVSLTTVVAVEVVVAQRQRKQWQ